MRETITVVAALMVVALLPMEASAASMCFGEKATITGTSGRDEIQGTPRADVIVTGDGPDVVHGRGGWDRICTGGGDDEVRGGSGSDRIFGGVGLDVLHGGRGDDRLIARAAQIPEVGYHEDLYGGPGNDKLTGGANPDYLFGGRGHDEIEGGGNQDDLTPEFLIGGPGDDRLSIRQREDWREYYIANFAPGPGVDLIDAGVYRATLDYSMASVGVQVDLDAGNASGEGTDTFEGIAHIEGSPFGDTLVGDAGYNRMAAGPGDDTSRGMAGTDELFGDWTVENAYWYFVAEGPESEALPSGDDTLFGGEDNDYLHGADGDDLLYGDEGDDSLNGESGTDALDGGEGTDTCANGESLTRCE